MEAAAKSAHKQNFLIFVDIWGPFFFFFFFEQITPFAVPEMFSKGFNLPLPPSAVAAVLGPKAAGDTQGPRFLMQVQAVAPKSCVLPLLLLSSHVPQMPTVRKPGDKGHTVLTVGVSSAHCDLCLTHTSVSHTGPRTVVGTLGMHQPSSCPLLLGYPGLPQTLLRGSQSLPEPCPHPLPSHQELPAQEATCQEKPCPRVSMSPRGSSALSCHAGHLLAGGLAALDPRSASQDTTATLLLCRGSRLWQG